MAIWPVLLWVILGGVLAGAIFALYVIHRRQQVQEDRGDPMPYTCGHENIDPNWNGTVASKEPPPWLQDSPPRPSVK